MTYAGLFSRFLAYCLDGFFLILPLIIFYASTFIFSLFGPFVFFLPTVLPLYTPVLLMIYFLYKVFFECSSLMATPGKRVMGIKVVDLNGNQLTFKASLIRFLIHTLSHFFFMLGYVFAIFTNKKQALHDIVAGSVVVIGREEGSIISAWFQSVKRALNGHLVEAPTSVKQPAPDNKENLEKLYQSGVISQEEYEKIKSRF